MVSFTQWSSRAMADGSSRAIADGCFYAMVDGSLQLLTTLKSSRIGHKDVFAVI